MDSFVRRFREGFWSDEITLDGQIYSHVPYPGFADHVIIKIHPRMYCSAAVTVAYACLSDHHGTTVVNR